MEHVLEFVFGPGMLFRNAVLGGLLVALVCSLLGVYVVLRRLVLLGVALPQAGAAGIAATFWITGHAHQAGTSHTSALVGSLTATFGSLVLLVAGQRGGRSPAEWGVGVLFAVASAATVLFVAMNPTGDLEMTNLLRGELLALSDADLQVLAVASTATLLLFFLFARDILLASFDAEFARTLGRNPTRADALLFLLLGESIALGVINAGPLVVFGFLMLPALAALRIAPGLGTAMAIAAAIGALSSVGGFVVAYRVDLPTGPTSVALAAACWLVIVAFARLRARPGRAGVVLLALALSASVAPTLGCGSFMKPRTDVEDPLPRGTLPDLVGQGPVSVARIRNETGQPLVIASGNPLKEVPRALGDPFREPAWTVPDALQEIAVRELARRGVDVRSAAEVRDALPDAPADPLAAGRDAKQAGLAGPVLSGTLRRFTLTQTSLLLVRLDLVLVDPERMQVLWRGSAQRPVPVRSALTQQEVLLDAGPAIFAEAFGSR
ncbi:MAG TPA: metal ABC transporter permease [Myxococcota bacterium]|nr:metal ABC transporter permease [Myxococcota bacterium]